MREKTLKSGSNASQIATVGGVAAILMAWLVAIPLGAAGPPFTILHSFSGPDGKNPETNLVLDSHRNLYGTVGLGGEGYGTVFTIKTDGSGFTVLHSFSADAADGEYPESGLVIDGGGDLFGTTNSGGANLQCPFFAAEPLVGCGTIFSLKSDGTDFRLLHSFSTSVSDGVGPNGQLILDASQRLFGTTYQGGQSNNCPSADGLDSCGTAFEITTDGTGFSLLGPPTFASLNVTNPAAGLVTDHNGTLFGTSQNGGVNANRNNPLGFGTVFTAKTDGSGYTVLHSFSAAISDGQYPSTNLVLDSGDSLYGTTASGGENGMGVVFTLKTDGSGFRLLHSFSGADGSSPSSGLLLVRGEYLIGTAFEGGANGGCGTPSLSVSCGVIFGMKTDGSEFTILHSFAASPDDGSNPQGGLILDSSGYLYGTTVNGGSNGNGTIFKLEFSPHTSASATPRAGVPRPGNLTGRSE